MARLVFRHLFVPALLVAWVASWSLREQAAATLRVWALGLELSSLVLLVSLLALWCAELAYPAHPDWNYRLFSNVERAAQGWRRLARDLLYFFVINQITAALIRLSSPSLLTFLEGRGLGLGSGWLKAAPFPLRVALAFLLVELGSYWMHRAAHRVPFFWRFHRTHHTATALTVLKAVQTHPIDNLFFHLARSVPLMLLGFGAEELVAVVYLCALLSFLAHSNIDVAAGPLGLLVNYPGYHEVHHSADVVESNSNFGCHSVLWDRVFGTFRPGASRPVLVGVHPPGERTAWQDLVEPLYRSAAPTGVDSRRS